MIYFVHCLTTDILSITSKFSVSFSCASSSARIPKRKLDATYIGYQDKLMSTALLPTLHSSFKAIFYCGEN